MRYVRERVERTRSAVRDEHTVRSGDGVAAPRVKLRPEIVRDGGRRVARQSALNGVERGVDVLAQKGGHVRANCKRRRVIDIVRQRSARMPEPGDFIRLVELAAMREVYLVSPREIGMGRRKVWLELKGMKQKFGPAIGALTGEIGLT